MNDKTIDSGPIGSNQYGHCLRNYGLTHEDIPGRRLNQLPLLYQPRGVGGEARVG